MTEHRARLDLSAVVLERDALLVDHAGWRTRVRERRLTSMADAILPPSRSA